MPGSSSQGRVGDGLREELPRLLYRVCSVVGFWRAERLGGVFEFIQQYLYCSNMVRISCLLFCMKLLATKGIHKCSSSMFDIFLKAP